MEMKDGTGRESPSSQFLSFQHAEINPNTTPFLKKKNPDKLYEVKKIGMSCKIL